MIRVLIAHSSRFVCDSLRSALGTVDDIYVVGGATIKEELDFLLPHCNVLILDTDLERDGTIETIQEIQNKYSETKVLVMGLDEDPDLIIRFIEAGASGYILHNESVDVMVGKLQAVQEEKAIVSPSMAAAMMQRLVHLANMDTPVAFMRSRQSQLDELTSRE